MELDLGLALHYHFPIKTAELNGNGGFEPKELTNDSFDDNFSDVKYDMNYINLKPNISTANCDDSDKVERKTLPLLIWNGQPNEEDQDGHRERTFQVCDQSDIYREFKEDNQVVGWPPIKSWRKRIIHGINHARQGGWHANERNNFVGRRNSMYVKVKMEGVAIGRKIDLRLYNSYQVLTNSLVQMFSKSDQSCDENGERFTLLYQDKEGDWMLAGDVPWQTFLETVRRIHLVSNGKTGRSTGKSSDNS